MFGNLSGIPHGFIGGGDGMMRLGASDGRRPQRQRLLANLGSLPFTQQQKSILNTKANLVQTQPSWINPSISSDSNAPSQANSFVVTTIPSGTVAYPFVAYGQPGAGPVTVISFSVPRSKVAFIRYLSVSHYGGNDPSGTGQVIWRVLQNGGGITGLNALAVTVGTQAAPQLLPAPIIGMENDTIIVTAEVTAGFAPMGDGQGTAAAFWGFTLPQSEATLPTPGSQ
jgi:hypothetical protein